MSPSTNPEISNIFQIPLDDIKISDENVRISHQTHALDELAESIKIHGLLQPVVLVGNFGAPPYQLISGQRRFLAHEKLNMREIKAVFTGPLSKTEAIIRSLVENMQRVDLSFEDTSKAVTALYHEFRSVEEIHKRTGLSPRTIRDHLEINERATEKMKSYIKEGKVSIMDVKRALRASQDNLTKADELVDLIIANSPTPNVKRRLIQYGTSDTRLSAEEIFDKASKPHVEEKILLTLAQSVQDSLQKASQKLEIDPSELAAKALEEWLIENGFLDGHE